MIFDRCFWLILLGPVLALGCASHGERLEPIREAYYQGNLPAAQQAVQKRLEKATRQGERDVFKLDLAMIELSSGRPKEAEELLRQVRDRFNDLEEKDVGELAFSMVTDDNAQAYSGEDYERVLIRAFLALSNLMHDGKDAFAYSLQVTEKQAEIISQMAEKKKELPDVEKSYKQVALGPYVRAMIAEESPLTLNEAAMARAKVVNFEPDFKPGNADLQRASHDIPIPPGHGVLYAFALLGKGPYKVQEPEIATQVSLLVADRIVSSCADRGLPPTIAPVMIPRVVNCYSSLEGIQVAVDGKVRGRTETLVHIGDMAFHQQQARYPEIIGRAVARRFLKKGAIYAIKEGLRGNEPIDLLLDVAGVAWEATETADTRCWGLLPDRIQVLRVELPVGQHEVVLQPAKRREVVGRPERCQIQIHEGRNSYLMDNFPDSRLLGKILTNSDSPSE